MSPECPATCIKLERPDCPCGVLASRDGPVVARERVLRPFLGFWVNPTDCLLSSLSLLFFVSELRIL